MLRPGIKRLPGLLLFITLCIAIPTTVQPSIADAVQPTDITAIWTIDIGQNGSAQVSISYLLPYLVSFNVTIPKTALMWHISNASVIFSEPPEDCMGIRLLNVIPQGPNVTLGYVWPDAALPFRGSYYFASNEQLIATPTHPRASCFSFINVTLPENSTLVETCSPFQMHVQNGRKIISLQAFGSNVLNYWEGPKLQRFVFTHPNYTDVSYQLQTEHIEFDFHPSLSFWCRELIGYAENAHLIQESIGGLRKPSGALKMHLAPHHYIRERRGSWVLAFYNSSEDAVYYPSDLLWSVYLKRFDGLQVLFHEIGHAHTMGGKSLPTFFEEGVAELFAYRTFVEMGLNEYASRMLNYRKVDANPLSDSSYNHTRFFNWTCDPHHLDYAHAFYVVRSLAEVVGFSSFHKVFKRIADRNANFLTIPNQSDRYDLLIFYLNEASGKDVADFFTKYGLYTHAENVWLASISHIFLLMIWGIVSVTAIMLLIIQYSGGKRNIALLLVVFDTFFFSGLMLPNAFDPFYVVASGQKWVTIDVASLVAPSLILLHFYRKKHRRIAMTVIWVAVGLVAISLILFSHLQVQLGALSIWTVDPLWASVLVTIPRWDKCLLCMASKTDNNRNGKSPERPNLCPTLKLR